MTGKLRFFDNRIGVTAALFLVVFGVSPVFAQSDSSSTGGEWQLGAAIYLWGADIGGETLRGSEIEVGFSDLVDNLELGGMGAFEARKNDWSVLVDIIYLGLGANGTTELSIPVGPGFIPVTTSSNTDVDGWVVNLLSGYNLYSDGKSRLDFVGGVRYLDLSVDIFLELESLGPGQSRRIEESNSFFDGVIGFRGQAALNDKWFLPYYIDVGAGDSESTWQVTAGVGYQARDTLDVRLVYRHIEWNLDSTRIVDEINFSGPALGVFIRW
jgi:opacity protein-like surface antigen